MRTLKHYKYHSRQTQRFGWRTITSYWLVNPEGKVTKKAYKDVVKLVAESRVNLTKEQLQFLVSRTNDADAILST